MINASRFSFGLKIAFLIFLAGGVAASAFSEEGGKNTDYEAVVRQAYAELLNRAPDKEGLAFYVRRLAAQGLTEHELREEIRNSREYRSRVSIYGAFAEVADYPVILWAASDLAIKPALWTSRAPDGLATGTLISAQFEAPRQLFFYLAGYPAVSSNRIALRDVISQEELEFHPLNNPGVACNLVKWRLGTNWVGRQVRLIATDNSVLSDYGWLGISEALPDYKPHPSHIFLRRAFYVAGLCSMHFLLFLLPGLSLALFIPPKLLQKPGRLLTATLILSCACGYLAFWVYFMNCFYGKLFSAANVVMILVALIKYRQRLLSSSFARELLWPVGIIVSISIFVLSLGFLYGGTEQPAQACENRFSHQLPADHALPFFGADKIYSGRPINQDKHAGVWRFSDRPPLQTGIVLLQSPLFMDLKNRSSVYLHYYCLSIPLQCLALAGLWILLLQLKVGRLVAGGVLSFIVFSPVFIVNSFYVWPKLLAVPFLFIVTTELLFRDHRGDRQDERVTGIIIGSSAALSLLAHGGSLFGLLGIAAATLVFRRLPSFRTILPALIPFTVLMLSWIIFQKVYDPPGDALLKFHLAGSTTWWDDRSVLATISDAYSRLSLGQIIETKLRNFAFLAGYPPCFSMPQHPTIWMGTVSAVRAALFFHLLPSVAPLLLTVPGLVLLTMFRRTRTSVSSAGLKCLTVAGATTVIWCLMMFSGPTEFPRTSIQHGTLLNPLIISAGLALVCFWLSRLLAIVLLMLQIWLFSAVYVPLSMPGLPWRILCHDIDHGMLIMVMLAIGAYIVLLSKALRPTDSDNAS